MAKKLPFNTGYNPNAIPTVGIACKNGLTEQNHAPECDINKIVATYSATGQLPDSNPPQYGDVTTAQSFQESQDLVAQTTQDFERLPADIRAKFQNQPVKLLEFLADENNHETARSLGLMPALPADLTDQPKPSASKAEKDGEKPELETLTDPIAESNPPKAGTVAT